MSSLPTISNYGDYSSSNYGAHTLRVDVGNLVLWYSYQTVIAFRADGRNTVVSENCYGVTTGKHINWVDGGDKKSRLPRPEFEKQLTDVLKGLGLLD